MNIVNAVDMDLGTRPPILQSISNGFKRPQQCNFCTMYEAQLPHVTANQCQNAVLMYHNVCSEQCQIESSWCRCIQPCSWDRTQTCACFRGQKANHSDYQMYADSKVKLFMLTAELQRRLHASGSSTDVFAVHPGELAYIFLPEA